jgi:putative spermidine/putrescine transport system permease protein
MKSRLVSVLIFFMLLALVGLPALALLVQTVGRRWYFPDIIPDAWTLDAWHQLFEAGGKIAEATATSFFIASSVTVMALFIGVPVGRLCALRVARHSRLIEFALLFPAIAPPIILATGVSVLFNQLGLNGTTAGVIFAHLMPTLPYAVLISIGIFTTFNVRYEEIAQTLGASASQIVYYVTLPMLREGIFTVALFSFLISWSQYALTLQIGAGRIQTLPVVVFAYINGGNPQFAATASVMMILPTLLVLTVAHRYLNFHSFGQR